MKKIVVLGGGGFIGGHLAKRLKEEGNHVRICDIKKHEYFFHDEICHEFILGDLTDPKVVELVIEEGVDEVYQLAADMGGALYIFTGEHDADVMYNSATINLNVARECVKKKVGKVNCVFESVESDFKLSTLAPGYKVGVQYKVPTQYAWNSFFY